MLQALREKTSGWIAVVIVIVLAIPFAFFGMEQYLFQSGGNYAARVQAPPNWWRSAPDWGPIRGLLWESEEVTVDEFRNAYDQERASRREALGDEFDPLAFESAGTRREVLERLIDAAALRLLARTRGLVVTDQQVRAEIERMPAFQLDGRFDQQLYLARLQGGARPMQPREFDALVRSSLQQSLIPTHVATSAFVTPAEVDRLLTLLGERRDVVYTLLLPENADETEVGDEQVETWYRDNLARYRDPQTVTVEYIVIDGNALDVDESIDEQSLRDRYEQERSRFGQGERRLVSQILVEVPAGADAAAVESARVEAAELTERAAAPGADFAALAREHSDDLITGSAGGDLGWIEPGLLGEAIDQALAEADVGQVQGPVRSDFGWHVLLVREFDQGEAQSFEEVRPQLEQELQANARERVYGDLVGRVVDQAYRTPNSLEAAAQEAGAEVQVSEPFARGQASGVLAHPAIQRLAFSPALIEDGTVSDPIEIDGNRSVLLRISGSTPERAAPLEDVRDRVIADVRADLALKQVQARADALVARLEAGERLAAVAGAEGLAVQDVDDVPRGVPAPHPDAVQAYFAVEVPEEGGVSVGQATIEGAAVVVFEVTGVTRGDPEEASEVERTMIQQQLATIAGNQSAQELLNGLRRQLKITVLEDRLQ